MLEKLVTWLIFSVLLAVVPLAATAVFQATRDLPYDLPTLTAQGELLLVAASLCAAATGELFASGSRARVVKLIAGGAAVVVLLFAAIYFASVVSARQAGVPMNIIVIYHTSLAVFAGAFVASGSCVALSKL